MIERILAWPNLCDAWERVAANRGSPGPDQVSIARFARHWEENLRRFQELVRGRHYRPGRLRRVAIPKRGGGQRLLSIANVGDRVLQRAALNVLEDHFERRFLACSYGYRPRRSLRHALAAILTLRDAGLLWVVDADIDGCFDSLDHELLIQFLDEDVEDVRVRQLLEMWVRAGVQSHQPDRGIAQGMPISPLLCNVYLHRLDWRLTRQRWPLVRYADDFIVCCTTQEQAHQAHRAVEAALADLNLRLNRAKTRMTSFEEGFEYLGIRFQRDRYTFTWQDKRFAVRGPAPAWLWTYAPAGYR